MMCRQFVRERCVGVWSSVETCRGEFITRPFEPCNRNRLAGDILCDVHRKTVGDWEDTEDVEVVREAPYAGV